MKVNYIFIIKQVNCVFLMIAKRLALLVDLITSQLAQNVKEVYMLIKINALQIVRKMVFTEILKLEFVRNVLRVV